MGAHLYFDTRRDGYGPDQCGKTLTVGELISILEEFDESTPIYFRNDNGYTYGGITEGRFEEDYGEED